MDYKTVISLGALTVSLLALCYTVYAGAKKNTKENNADDTKIAIDLATQNVKLDTVLNNTNEIRIEQRHLSTCVSDLSNRMVKVEESTKSAHKRIDGMEDKK